ncbi:MAG: ParB/RepB/Spo0J family partition protein [Salibaculum sp.]|jgi:ParB family chromosome partitioning protein|uniref:ParB/RepB/Spo0J family partition protein n=1 Tax=Roseovarius halophilus (ex Wu et al. 2025) TaxID=3376060 RepID=UPI0028705778|nr:ParB/RepB/Spo0J family partition protein [Salibaculum sp.]MDR9482203.1 ParB/RepB/Spo0J family partition protein [Salibaculum sp.]
MSDNTSRTRGLGRGLSSLMSDVVAQDATAGDRSSATETRPDRTVPIEKIRPNPDQPRRSFNDAALTELADSIRSKGVIQPLIVRATDDAMFEIVAGERRWRAAQKAGLHDLPVLVRDLSDTEVLQFAIIENIQRADLNAVDEATGYRQLMDRFNHTQEELASALGKSRSHIANLLRLLTLPEDVQQLMSDGRLSAGHARTLVGKENAGDLAREIIKNDLSVRQAEKLASTTRKAASPGPKLAEKDADTKTIEKELAAHLGMGVSIDHEAGVESGKLTLRYRDLGQLDDLLRLLSGD